MIESAQAVFLSYASEDAEAAQRISDALRGAGLEVWFDRSELRGGDAWDAMIRRQIRTCVLFIPLISANSRFRSEGYFRLEWKLAVDRSHLMASDRPFLVPVVIDATHEGDARVPEKFWEVQWTRLPGGEAPPAFIERIRRLLTPGMHAPAGSAGVPATPNRNTTASRNAAATRGAAETYDAAATHDAAETYGSAPTQGARNATERAQGTAAGRPPSMRKRTAWLALALAVILIAAAVVLTVRFKAGPPAAPVTAAAGSEQSIAILPFVDMSEKKDQEYFSDGISEELIDLVSRGTNLRVPARTSSFYFKGKQVTIAEIAQALGVTHVLEGSIRKAGGTVRVTVQLIRAPDGYHLWSATYDRELKDIFQVQDEIAATVVEALKSRLSAPAAKLGRPANADAHNEYLLGKQAFNRGNPEGFQSAIASFHRAIELDPRYGAAYAELATAEAYWADNGGGPADVEQGLKDADEAIALAPNLPDGYVSRGLLRFSRKWDWSGAQADLEKALHLDAGDATTQRRYGGLLAALGRLPEGIAAVKKAIDIDPLSNAAWGNLGVYYSSLGQFGEARKALQRALEINPNSVYAHWNLGLLEMLDGHSDNALTIFPESGAVAFHQAGLAMAQHSLKNDAQSKSALEVLTTKLGDRWAYQIAEVYAWLGERDAAFQWLQRAYAQHDGGLIQVKYDRLLVPLRGDARYRALLRQMNLPL